MSFLLKFLLISIGILYLIRLLARLLLPMLFQSVVNKAQQHAQQQPNAGGSKNGPTGRIKIDFIPEETKKAKIPETEGDFVEYEEIKK